MKLKRVQRIANLTLPNLEDLTYEERIDECN